MSDDKILIALTVAELSKLRGAIDVCIRTGGTQAARQLLDIDRKIEMANESKSKQ